MDWNGYPGLKPQANAAMVSTDDSRRVDVRGTVKAKDDPTPKDWVDMTEGQRDMLADLYKRLAKVLAKDAEAIAQPIVDAVTDDDVRKVGQAWIDATIMVRDAARNS